MARIMVRRTEIIGEIKQASTFEVELPMEASEFWTIFRDLLSEFQGQKIEMAERPLPEKE